MATSKFDLLFLPHDPVIEFVTWKNQLFLCWPSLHMRVKFEDNSSETAICIVENETISFKHEYRRHNLTSRCDVIGDVIIMKIILVDDLYTIFL